MIPRKQKFIKIEAPLIDEISELFYGQNGREKAWSALMLKIKFVRNLANLEVMNSSLATLIFDPKDMLGLLDLR